MPTVFIEARAIARDGEAIIDYVAEDVAGRVLGAFETQEAAITWAQAQGHHPLIARVRPLSNKAIADHWRVA